MKILALGLALLMAGCADRITHAPWFVVNTNTAAEVPPPAWDRPTLDRIAVDRSAWARDQVAFDDAMILTLMRREQTRRLIRYLNR